MFYRIIKNVANDISSAFIIVLELATLASRSIACVLPRHPPHLDILVKLSDSPVHELAIVLHSLYVWYSHEEMFDPRCSCEWADSPMGYVI